MTRRPATQDLMFVSNKCQISSGESGGITESGAGGIGESGEGRRRNWIGRNGDRANADDQLCRRSCKSPGPKRKCQFSSSAASQGPKTSDLFKKGAISSRNWNGRSPCERANRIRNADDRGKTERLLEMLSDFARMEICRRRTTTTTMASLFYRRK